MRMKLFVVAALAIATIGPPAAIAATGPEVKIAIERAATASSVYLVPSHQAAGMRLAGGGKLDVVSPAIPAAAAPSSSAGPGPWRQQAMRDRDPVAYHLRL